jgi:mannose-P-dolichol utilization defect protein 1
MYGYLYGHPFTAYGENASLLLQNIILIGLSWNFLNKTASPVSTKERILVVLSFILYFLTIINYLPEEYRYMLMSATWPVMLYARGSQVLETYSVKHTGNLSIVTTSMNLVGALIRILTTINETGDVVVLAGYLLSGGLSFIMFVQYWFYLQETTKLSKDTKEKKKQ